MQHKRILIVSNMFPSKQYPSYGVFVKNFCDQLKSLGFDFDLSIMTKTEKKPIKIVKYAKFYTDTFFKCLLGKYDVVYVHYPSFSAAPVNLAKYLRKFVMITNVHGTDVIPLKHEHVKMMGNTKKAISNSIKVVVPSKYFKELVMQKYKIEDKNVFIYPSAGIDKTVFYPYDEKLMNIKKEEYMLEDDTIVLGFVSRICKAKGWDIFIEALQKCTAISGKKKKIFLVGSGEDDKLLETSILSLPEDLRGAICRYPLIDQRKLADLYNLMDVFVFPTMSESESLGLVAIEAMSCGIPVIASDFAAPAYYVENGVNGFKFEKGNSAELAQKIDAFLSFSGDRIKDLKHGALVTAQMYERSNIEQGLKEILQ